MVLPEQQGIKGSRARDPVPAEGTASDLGSARDSAGLRCSIGDKLGCQETNRCRSLPAPTKALTGPEDIRRYQDLEEFSCHLLLSMFLPSNLERVMIR